MKVLTLGTFDLVHEGHVKFLEACCKLAGDQGTVSVGVNSDEFVKMYKRRKPVMPWITRATVIGALRTVDEVFKNTGNGNWPIREHRPDILVIGSDWAKKNYYRQIRVTQKELDAMGILLVYVPYTPGVSSTLLRGR